MIEKYTNVQNDIGGMKRLKFIINVLKKHNVETVLDVGCGTGSVTIPLGLEFNVLGIDIHDKSIDIAKERNKVENTTFLTKDIKKIEKKYDATIAIQVLEHLEEPLEMLKEMYKRTEKITIITVPHGYGPSEVIGRAIQKIRGTVRLTARTRTNEGMFTANYDNPHVQKFTVKEMKELSKNAGYKSCSTYNHTFILGTFPFNQLFFRTPFGKFFEKIDARFSKRIPYFMASGYYFVMEK